MREYGIAEAEGSQGHHPARIALRAPRVAVRVEAATNWQSMFGLAMSMACGVWGGYGFIYIPRGSGNLHPALTRILSAYDPDYLVDAWCTRGEIEAIEPGWHASHIKGWPVGPDESAAWLVDHFIDGELIREDLSDDLGGNLCSPFYEQEGVRPMQVLSTRSEGALHTLTTVLGSTRRATFEVPEGLDPLLTLALGLRVGFPAKPPLPLGRHADGTAERLPHRYVAYVLSTEQERTGLGFDGLTTAWNLTRTGLVPVRRPGPPARPVTVIGSTADDFALAVALDRMYGTTIWVPAEWTEDPDLRWPVQHGYEDLLQAARRSGRPPIVTSISLSEDQLNAAVQAKWPEPIQAWNDQGNTPALDSQPPEFVPAEQLDLHAPSHLACTGDYDLPFTSPTRSDGRGGFEFVLPIPAHTPSSEELRGPQRPFWEVDVEVYPPRVPTGRNLSARALLADDEPYLATVLRSGRDGISFNPMSMLFVSGGATLQQSIAKPRLHMLGLRGWIAALVVQDQPETAVRLSQAGRRAMILTRLWGSRSAVARDLLELNDFLREFKPSGKCDMEAYPNRDGVRLTSTEGYLTFAAAARTLPGMETAQIRNRLNHLLHINVLQRGLVVPCSECERRAFYRIELLGENNTCPRCGAPAHATDAWRSQLEEPEPEWFYDLHGAVRELLQQDGDVPFLAGQALAAQAQTFEEIAELDFLRPDQDPDEIDIVALVDGRLVIGEAKCVPTLGTKKESNKAIAKLLRISDLLGADEILLATSAPGPWKESQTDQLLKATAGQSWRFGKVPQVRVMTDLRAAPQSSLLRQEYGGQV